MPIPKNAKQVFKGVIFNTYQWPQEMFDGTVSIFEMVERKSTVDVIAVLGDKIIVLRQEQPGRSAYPSLPGGRVEEGQTPEIAARAELLQETGYEAGGMELFCEFFGDSKVHFHQSIFIARNCTKVSEKNLDSGEKIEMELNDFESFLQLCRNDKFAVSVYMKFMMYEALLDESKKEDLRKKIFNL